MLTIAASAFVATNALAVPILCIYVSGMTICMPAPSDDTP